MTVTPGASDGAAVSNPALSNGKGNTRAPADVAQLRAEIARTRAELGETVQALAARADVKARLHEQADEAKARLRERMHTAAADARAAASDAPARAQLAAKRLGAAIRANPVPYAVAFGATAALITFIRWRRNRR